MNQIRVCILYCNWHLHCECDWLLQLQRIPRIGLTHLFRLHKVDIVIMCMRSLWQSYIIALMIIWKCVVYLVRLLIQRDIHSIGIICLMIKINSILILIFYFWDQQRLSNVYPSFYLLPIHLVVCLLQIVALRLMEVLLRGAHWECLVSSTSLKAITTIYYRPLITIC